MRARLVATFAGVSLCGLALAADPANGLDQTVIVKQGMTDLSTLLATNGKTILEALVLILGFGVIWKLTGALAHAVCGPGPDDYDPSEEEDDEDGYWVGNVYHLRDEDDD